MKDIKLSRTDTTLDLSHKAEKVYKVKAQNLLERRCQDGTVQKICFRAPSREPKKNPEF